LEPEPQRFLTYEGRVKNGGILLSVHCDDSSWTKKAKEILVRTGAEDVSSTGEAGADFAKSDRPVSRKQMLWLSLGNRICKPVAGRVIGLCGCGRFLFGIRLFGLGGTSDSYEHDGRQQYQHEILVHFILSFFQFG
jgi:hypothetical protein